MYSFSRTVLATFRGVKKLLSAAVRKDLLCFACLRAVTRARRTRPAHAPLSADDREKPLPPLPLPAVTSPLAAVVLPLPAVTSHRQGPSRRYRYRHRYHGWPADASRRTRYRYQPLPAAIAAVCYRYRRYPDDAGDSFTPSSS
jgi:hypothetical protein